MSTYQVQHEYHSFIQETIEAGLIRN
uniref:Uncharacterized protein n=1 Tax=Arundo donax TaxID=35708 RepID=A0A0A8ZWB8_ARUDO